MASSVFSIDVECVATGMKHDARSVAQIALVDGNEQPVLNLYVRPEEEVVSYLAPLTGASTVADSAAGAAAAFPGSPPPSALVPLPIPPHNLSFESLTPPQACRRSC